MSKKFRKTGTAGKRAAGETSGVEIEAEVTEVDDEAPESASPVSDEPARTAAGTSPLLRSQEKELEIGLSLLGIIFGLLTGYGNGVPPEAPSGNVVGAIEAGIIGGLLGYTLGRTLFFSVRAQWISWVALLGLVYGGQTVGGLPGGVLGAVLGASLVCGGALSRFDDVPGPAASGGGA